ncbi:MAG: YtxH domain-containing protein [Ardenticatenaceae bacterium]|nr:YtxH domain-containing protein [Ardenticatenaceae bacterium]HBY96954.1 hypothetical protein [Chloroflexota bacterium]
MRFTLGFVLGAAFGASATLLMTPHAGAANREWLRRKTDELAGGESLVSEVVRTVRESIAERRARIERAIQTGKETAERQEAALWQQLKLAPPTEQDVQLTPPEPPVSTT